MVIDIINGSDKDELKEKASSEPVSDQDTGTINAQSEIPQPTVLNSDKEETNSVVSETPDINEQVLNKENQVELNAISENDQLIDTVNSISTDTDVKNELISEDIPEIPVKVETNEFEGSNDIIGQDESNALNSDLSTLKTEQEILIADVAGIENLTLEDDQKSEVDFSSLSKSELLNKLELLIQSNKVEEIIDEVENIKINFYKKNKYDFEQKRKLFLEAGNKPEDFVPEEDPIEIKFKELLKNYKDQKSAFNQKTEAEKQDNLKKKHQIIDEIKHLVSNNESFNETFHQFKELQKKWREIGPVPQANVNDLWKSYNHQVEAFYDYIKINKELRDLDLKKNLEAKLVICEKAETLLLEPSIVKAFKQLQELHDQWKELGPVPHESRNDIWERFKDITTKINKLHQEYFENLKDQQQKNLEAKTLLCEKAEELSKIQIDSVKDWDNRSKEMVELQNVWRTIGFAPKKDNNRIYERFRVACDEFFNKKREFLTDVKEEYNTNLQLKLDLCVQAESLKDSTEWKKTTDELINIQKRWKEIGPVPRKQSDIIWKRFRTACDEFFNRKSTHFSSIDSQYDENLRLKNAIIEELENFKITEDIESEFEQLKDIQRRWTEIGFVPLAQKESINNKYRGLINKLFDSLKLDDNKRNIMKYRNKLETLPHTNKTDNKINKERDKFIIRLKKLESDIVLWENNIGFFANTKNAQAMIQDVQNKIDSAKTEIKVLEEKIKMIDKME